VKSKASPRQAASGLILITLLVLELISGGVSAATIQISAGGSTFAYPMYSKWSA
jgi:ABC-type phosphate transport system substrate-binding protein